MDIKLTEKEILDYAIAEEGLLFASADDYLAIAEIVIEQINIKLKSAQPAPGQSEPVAWTCNDIYFSNCNSDTLEQFCRDNIRLAPFFAMLANKLAAQPTSQDVLGYVERLEETLKDAISLRVKLFRGGDFEGDTDKLPDSEIINRESYARKWQKALDSRPESTIKRLIK